MATPQTFTRDPATGDLSLAGGTLALTTTLRDYVIAHLAECLSMFAGEWFFDTREGVPYFRIVSTRPDLALLRSLFRRAVANVPGVADVIDITVVFDGKTRTLSVTVSAALADGDVITNVPYLVPWIVTDSTGVAA